jgi:hypothetical protein
MQAHTQFMKLLTTNCICFKLQLQAVTVSAQLLLVAVLFQTAMPATAGHMPQPQLPSHRKLLNATMESTATNSTADVWQFLPPSRCTEANATDIACNGGVAGDRLGPACCPNMGGQCRRINGTEFVCTDASYKACCRQWPVGSP